MAINDCQYTRQAATISIVKIFICFMNNFFAAAAALHSAWIDAYTMFRVNDGGRESEWNEFVRFISCNSFIKQQNQQIRSQCEQNYFRLCVWFSREITFCDANWWIYNFNKRHALWLHHSLTRNFYGGRTEWKSGREKERFRWWIRLSMHRRLMTMNLSGVEGNFFSFLLIRLRVLFV